MRGSTTLPRVLALLLVAVVVFTLPAWVGDYWTRIFTGVWMWAGLALAWNIIGGYAGYVSFGHAAFFGLGAYTTALLTGHPPWWRVADRFAPRLTTAGGAPSLLAPWRARMRPAPPGGGRHPKRPQDVAPRSANQ